MSASNSDDRESRYTNTNHGLVSSGRGVGSTSGDRGRRRGEPSTQQLIYAVGAVVALWVIWLCLQVLLFGVDDMVAMGQFGDLFGGVNALFTGLAFAGLIFTILLQRHDLYIQSKELELTRKELERSAEAQAGSQEALTKQVGLLQDSTRLSVISTLADNYMSQRNTVEQGGFRRELWQADFEIRDWGHAEAGKQLGYWEALERGMQSDLYKEYKGASFRTSFEAWVHARRQHARLLSILEETFEKLGSAHQDASGSAEGDATTS